LRAWGNEQSDAYMQDWPSVNRLRRLKSAKGDVGYFEVDVMFDGEPVKVLEKIIWVHIYIERVHLNNECIISCITVSMPCTWTNLGLHNIILTSVNWNIYDTAQPDSTRGSTQLMDNLCGRTLAIGLCMYIGITDVKRWQRSISWWR